MRFTRIPVDTFQNLQLNAGVLAKNFTPGTGELDEQDLLQATTGGVTFNATPTFSDWGDDIDNCPKNMKELKRIESWDITLSGTYVSQDAESIKSTLGAADVGDETYALTTDTALVAGKTYYTRTGTDPDYVYTPVASPSASSLSTYYEFVSAKITPRTELESTDFGNLWWIGDYSDKNGATNGGFIAVHLLNALSTGGLQIKSTDKAKGNFAFTYTAHYSMAAQTTVPFEVYVTAGTAEPSGT